jgi:hypothetical protein
VRFLRSLLSLLLFAATAFCVVKVTSGSSPAPVEAPCNVASLSAAFSGPLTISSVQNYACEEGWAFLWATVGKGQEAVGVTEVVHYDVRAAKWRVAKRLLVCTPKILPHYIYEQGCFSN